MIRCSDGSSGPPSPAVTSPRSDTSSGDRSSAGFTRSPAVAISSAAPDGGSNTTETSRPAPAASTNGVVGAAVTRNMPASSPVMLIPSTVIAAG